MKQQKSFETSRLILKPTTEEDAPFIFELFNSPKWLKYIGDKNIRTVENAKEFIKTKITPQFEKLGYGNYTIVRKDDSVKLGTCGLYDRDGLVGVDIGFAFLPQYEKKGYAFEASNKLKLFGIKEFGLQTIKGITKKNNVASQELLKKLGLHYSNTVILPNETEELLVFKLEVKEQ